MLRRSCRDARSASSFIKVVQLRSFLIIIEEGNLTAHSNAAAYLSAGALRQALVHVRGKVHRSPLSS